MTRYIWLLAAPRAHKESLIMRGQDNTNRASFHSECIPEGYIPGHDEHMGVDDETLTNIMRNYSICIIGFGLNEPL